MKKKQILFAMMTTIMFGGSIASAHRVQFQGSAKSNSDLITNTLIAAQDSDKTIRIITEGAKTIVFREDANNAINCVKTIEVSACEVVMKHERPLEAFDKYPVGKEMTLKGASDSNAHLIFGALKSLKATDSTVNEIVLSETKSRLARDTDDLRLACLEEAGAESECQLNTK